MTSVDKLVAETQAAFHFALQSSDPRCAALRSLLLQPPPSDSADNKERFAAALAAACSAMTDSPPASSLQPVSQITE